MERIISQTEIEQPIELVGGKANGLLKLKALEPKILEECWDYDCQTQVPPFFVIPHNITLAKFRAEILNRAREIGESYAVRSSSPLEDVGENSFDGIFDTKLNVSLDNLLESIHFVRKSALSEKAQAYSRDVCVALTEKMPIIVQKMISEKDFTGVVYSKFPCPSDITKVIRDSTHYKERYIDCFPRKKREDGLMDIFGNPIVIAKDYTNSGENRQESLAKLAVNLENELGYPIILEFATYCSENKFIINLLQARKLTKLSTKISFEMPELQEKGLIASTYDLNGAGDFSGESYVITKYDGINGVEAPDIEKFDAEHSGGYVLVTPYLQFYETHLDRFTPNKMAVVAYTDLGKHHNMEISRKKNILYLNVQHSLGLQFYETANYGTRPPIETGERVRVVSNGERGIVFNLST